MKDLKKNLKQTGKIAIFHTSKATYRSRTKKEFKGLKKGFDAEYYGVNVSYWFENLDEIIERTGIDADGLYELGFIVSDNSCTWNDENKKFFDSLEIKNSITGELITHEDLGDAVLIDDSGNSVTSSEEYGSEEGTMDLDGDYDTYHWAPIWKLNKEDLEIILDSSNSWEWFNEGGVSDKLKELVGCFSASEAAEMIINTELNLVEMMKNGWIKETTEDNEEEEWDAVEINGKYYTIK